MASFFSNVPISEPVIGNFVKTVDFNGLGWDPIRGLFIPVSHEYENPILPYQDVLNPSNPVR